MGRRILLIFLFVIFPFAPPLPAGVTLRILCYNIHHGEGMDGRVDLARIAEVIRGVEPDLVALQEVDVRAQRSGGVDQALELARLTGMHVLYGATMPFQGGQYGNALLSRLPAAGFRNHALPFTPGREPRAILDASFTQPAAFRVLATHLDITRPDRLSAVEALGGIAPPGEAAPMIFLGDLNDTLDSPVLDQLHAQGWRSAVTGPTFPVKDPKRQIDFILYRPAARWRVVQAKVLDERVASDHLPVFAVLEFVPLSPP